MLPKKSKNHPETLKRLWRRQESESKQKTKNGISSASGLRTLKRSSFSQEKRTLLYELQRKTSSLLSRKNIIAYPTRRTLSECGRWSRFCTKSLQRYFLVWKNWLSYSLNADSRDGRKNVDFSRNDVDRHGQ